MCVGGLTSNFAAIHWLFLLHVSIKVFGDLFIYLYVHFLSFCCVLRYHSKPKYSPDAVFTSVLWCCSKTFGITGYLSDGDRLWLTPDSSLLSKHQVTRAALSGLRTPWGFPVCSWFGLRIMSIQTSSIKPANPLASDTGSIYTILRNTGEIDTLKRLGIWWVYTGNQEQRPIFF